MTASYFNEEALRNVFDRCAEIGKRKSHDYGASGDAIAMAGIRGVVIRNLDKQLRCMSLTEPGHETAVKDESLRDTLMDQINYAAYGVMLLDGTWGKRPEDKPEDSARRPAPRKRKRKV